VVRDLAAMESSQITLAVKSTFEQEKEVRKSLIAGVVN
jgi:hypothetical protein